MDRGSRSNRKICDVQMELIRWWRRFQDPAETHIWIFFDKTDFNMHWTPEDLARHLLDKGKQRQVNLR